MYANPGFGVIQGDVTNGYNEITREAVLNSIRDTGRLNNTLPFSHTRMHLQAYVGMGSGTQLTKAPFKCAEGVHQGAVESCWFFALGFNKAFQKYNTTLLENGVRGMAMADNNYAMGHPDHIFQSHQTFSNDLINVELQLQPTKS